MKLSIRVPTELLSAHDDGQVVFFCGAGISRYTGLPDFKKLVEDIFKKCGLPLVPEGQAATGTAPVFATRTPEEEAFCRGAYDRALHLLEAKSEYMRPATVELLGGDSTDPALATHKALLALSSHPGGGHRLVTTNFDLRFEEAEPGVPFQAGPFLSMPRKESWRRLTYLHGRLDPANDPEGRDLVLTSGDFSRAYLQDGWAARFALSLLENYTVVFVGYSLNDPVVGYLIDGVAADMRCRGEKLNAYIFADHDGTPADQRAVETSWTSRGVTPLPFNRAGDFIELHQTLQEWAALHTARRAGNFSVLLAPFQRPYDSKEVDEAERERLVWLLSAGQGALATAFANTDPPPDVSWLSPLAKTKVTLAGGRDPVSLFDLPSPRLPTVPLAGPGAVPGVGLPLSPVTFQLGRWLARHRDKKELVEWVIDKKGILHPGWAFFIQNGLNKIPEPYAAFWRLVLDIQRHAGGGEIFLRDRPLGSGPWPMNGDARLAQAVKLRPRLSKSFRRFFAKDLQAGDSQPRHLSDLVEIKLEEAGADDLASIWDARTQPEISTALVRNADVLTSALAEGARLLRAFNRPIKLHSRRSAFRAGEDQNDSAGIEMAPRGVALVARLCLAAFEAAREGAPFQAAALVHRWMALGRGEDLSIFRRMALHALATVQPGTADEELGLVLENHGAVLWGDEYEGELGRYLRQRAPALPAAARDRLIAAITSGPTRELWPGFTGSGREFRKRVLRDTANRLAKLREGGVALSAEQDELVNSWETKDLEQDAPVRSVSDGGVPEEKADSLLDLSSEAMADHFAKTPNTDAAEERLADLCANHPDVAVQVIPLLAERVNGASLLWGGIWNFRDIKDATQRFSILRMLSDVFSPHPQMVEARLCWALGEILKTFAETIPDAGEERGVFLAFWETVWTRAVAGAADGKQDLLTAINEPGGELATAVVDLALRGEGPVPPDVMALLERIVDGETPTHRLGRIVLASRLLWLYRRNPAWTQQHLMARMNGDHPEAPGLWQGFCWAKRLDRFLMVALHDAFLSVAGRIEDWETRNAWNDLFAETLAEAPDLFTAGEVGQVMKGATGQDLAQMASQLTERLKRAGDKAPAQWATTIRPIIENKWPSTTGQRTNESVSELVNLALAAQSEFPDAIALMRTRKLLGPFDGRTRLFYCFARRKSGEIDPCATYPEAVLSLFDAIVGDTCLLQPEGRWVARDIAACLDRITTAAPSLARDPRVERLRRLLGGAGFSAPS
ncbi:SIR2 family protein [Pararhodospirillum oryzae]|uniref:Uncharacterized protein n=1 Tax=Pararhodospirillum oryzae TaxID=478448 RepID=A0A512H562_9PROT|nr:SIR2 family protein [Pararhodospirillum oryzae]GEO80568.1 hypothetical protein ROR02_06990 [Pararhodospirillum oryzae]